MCWTASADRPDKAPIEINYNGGVLGGLTTLDHWVDETINGGTWVKIATNISFTGGSGDYVRLFATNAGFTIADAVRWVPTGDAVGSMATDQTDVLSLADLKKESAIDNGFLVYPNPATGAVNLSFNAEAAGKATIEIYTSLGQKVISVNKSVLAGNNNLKIDLSNIPVNGVYYVKVVSASKVMNQTLMIHK